MTNYYSQEICAPARAALLTGRYPSRIGLQFGQLLPTETGGLPLSETLLPEVLRDYGGYKSYALGKWNLGHSSPSYLATARGFDYYLGSLTSENTYWSKSMPEYAGMKDFTEATPDKWGPYKGDDLSTYSTFLYRNHAMDIIDKHDFESNPMFMYLAFQAAHPPFEDMKTHTQGLDEEYFTTEIYDKVMTYTAGHLRQQYTLSIILMDQAVEEIVKRLTDRGQIDNTYIIFASDNGGCPQNGGFNGQLRGTKGTLFEGGVKVDAFVYHASWAKKGMNKQYPGMMHVSDWFPTMLDMAGIHNYHAKVGKMVEGYSHYHSWNTGILQGPRKFLLYNYYNKVDGQVFLTNKNATVAVRDQRYKLIHTFVNTPYSTWFASFSDKLSTDDDDAMQGPACTEERASVGGTFEFMLFDLVKDPYEQVNLFNDPNYEKVKQRLMTHVRYHDTLTRQQEARESSVSTTTQYWYSNGKYAQPWVQSTKNEL